jgi:heterodisulfide reductase subunit B2
MTDIAYYPGCTIKSSGRNFETTTLALLRLFGINAVEVLDWYCCGVMASQTAENLMPQLAPLRTLAKAAEAGHTRLLTLCSMCYNTLKRAQLFVQASDPDKRERIAQFLDGKDGLCGDGVDVVHLLNVLGGIAPDVLRGAVKRPVEDLRVAAYYGCLLLRPKAAAITPHVEKPGMMEALLTAAGCQTVYFPFATECCTSFQIVKNRDLVKTRARAIVASAVKNGADLLALSCPLCRYNLDAVQRDIAAADPAFTTIPVLYFTQILALACGLDPGFNDFSLHHIDPRPLLQAKGLI